ncbi:MAG: PEP/pyruvate-binding domain-containing protein [Woeseia sp.]
MRELIVRLGDEAATDSARFGSKAANQALLGRAGLPIQPGFCLDAQAYRLQLKAAGLEQAAAAVARVDRPEARPTISRVRIGLFESPVTPSVLGPLRKVWREPIVDGAAAMVVRSSALIEDVAGSTFAGQFETFLGLEAEHDFLTAVRACWAALWSSRAVQYMSSHALSPADTAMALCIQPLVEARVSGGGMSRTADGNMMLSATWGLGTSIAQGEIVPDHYRLSRDGELLGAVAGDKGHSAFCAHRGAARSTGFPAKDLAGRACLDSRQAVELGQLMLRAERLLGVPIEIEWALDEAGFKLLQARPLRMEPAAVPDEMWSRHPGLRGQPSGIGWASGRSCVISCECELSRVAPGDVLVTGVAGPALSQVLPGLAGVVAELGGSTSHLASLARERGIPMVLGVPDATRKIPDGAQVGVDGVMGTVRWQR